MKPINFFPLRWRWPLSNRLVLHLGILILLCFVQEAVAQVTISCRNPESLGCNPARVPTAAELIAGGYVTAVSSCGRPRIIESNAPTTAAIACVYFRVYYIKAIDDCGNQSETCTILVTWTEDTRPPTISCGTTFVDLGCNPTQDGIRQKLLDEYVEADDDCDLMEIKSTPGDVEFVGCRASQAWSFVAVDGCGNESEACIIIVSWTVDKQPPVILSCPAGGDLGCAPVIIPLPNPGAVLSVDRCGKNTIQVFTSESKEGCKVSLVYEYVVTDECGNKASCEQIFTYIEDFEPPTINCNTSTIVFGCNPDEDELPQPRDLMEAHVSAEDNCGVRQIEFLAPINFESDCGATISWPFVAIDHCGNRSDPCYISVTWIVDKEPPTVIYCPPHIDLGCNPQHIPEPTPNAVELFDKCGIDRSNTKIEKTVSEIDLSCRVFVDYLYTFIDFCGNSVQCSQRYSYIVDKTKPTFLFLGGDLSDQFILCNELIPPPPTYLAIDFCTSTTLDFQEHIEPSPLGYRIVRTWTATDGCGNMETRSQHINVSTNGLQHRFGYRKKVICGSTGNQLNVSAQGGQPPYSYQWQSLSGGGTITSGANSPGMTYTAGDGPMVFKVTITDASGCMHMATVTIVCERPSSGGGRGNLANNGVGKVDRTPEEIKLYPNPLNQRLLQVDLAAWAGAAGTILLYDALGRPVYRQRYEELPAGVFRIELPDLASGQYYFRLVPDDGAPVTKPLVVLRK